MNNALISVITVCLNAEKNIGCTINSILEQDTDCFEYVIRDGGSDDSTISILESYEDSFREKNIPCRIISGKDGGLYDAMNKAADVASGEWIVFMNAGDEFFDENSLSKLARAVSPDADVIYGDALFLENGRYKLLKAGTAKDFRCKNPICHQASLTRASVVRKYRFDTRYDIAADFDMFLKMHMKSPERLRRIDEALCIFRLGGISSKEIFRREKEFDDSRRNCGFKRVAFPGLQIVWTCIVHHIRTLAVIIFGNAFYSKSRGWYAEKNLALKGPKKDV